MSRSSEIRSQRYKAQRMREQKLRELELVQQHQYQEDDEEEEHYVDLARPVQTSNPENILPLNEHNESFNLVPLVFSAIKSTSYYKQTRLKTFNELVDEIYLKVTHLDPYEPASGLAQRPASPAFCLLLKSFEMKLTKNQMQTLLNHQDSPFIRCLGVLYLRYISKFDALYDWLEPLLGDAEVFHPHRDKSMTVGEWTRGVLTNMRYRDTLFPRIPLLIEKSIQAKLEGAESSSKSANPSLKPGTLCRAIYSEDGQWYDARIEEPGDAPDQYWVTFLPEDEYGNQEQVHLKDIDLGDTPSEESSSKRARVAAHDEQAEVKGGQ
jgi:hypothetical protein